MFNTLYKCLEEGQGTDELKKLSKVINNELNRKTPMKGRVNNSLSTNQLKSGNIVLDV